jgi:hypothetical protein
VYAAVNHLATPDFWFHYRQLPETVRELADKNFRLLAADRHHPSLRFKRVGDYWTARVGLHYRALSRHRGDDIVWFWIGHHGEYDQILRTSG